MIIKNDWALHLDEEFEKPYYKKLRAFLKDAYSKRQILPDKYDVFNAFHITPYDNVKVVIIGQDPYHGLGQAHGLSFSVKQGLPKPPSLLNIFKELNSDLGLAIPKSGDLSPWALEGVLLLNTVLTVEMGKPQSHKGLGWEEFTDKAIKALVKRDRPMVFVLWGKSAMEKESLIKRSHHKIIKSAHPSPLSAHRGFFGSKPFSEINNFLIANSIEPINWKI